MKCACTEHVQGKHSVLVIYVHCTTESKDGGSCDTYCTYCTRPLSSSMHECHWLERTLHLVPAYLLPPSINSTVGFCHHQKTAFRKHQRSYLSISQSILPLAIRVALSDPQGKYRDVHTVCRNSILIAARVAYRTCKYVCRKNLEPSSIFRWKKR